MGECLLSLTVLSGNEVLRIFWLPMSFVYWFLPSSSNYRIMKGARKGLY